MTVPRSQTAAVSPATFSRLRLIPGGILRRMMGAPIAVWILLGILPLAAPRPAGCEGNDDQIYGEYQVKAAFLYNFAKFVEWPAGAFADGQSPIRVGVVGNSAFSTVLEQVVKGKTANGREMSLEKETWPGNLDGYHILFVGSDEGRNLPQILSHLKGKPVLTVGESETFAKTGGVINFILEGKKVRFEINVDNAEQAGLKISSKLLTLAKLVRNEARGGPS